MTPALSWASSCPAFTGGSKPTLPNASTMACRSAVVYLSPFQVPTEKISRSLIVVVGRSLYAVASWSMWSLSLPCELLLGLQPADSLQCRAEHHHYRTTENFPRRAA